MTNERTNDVFKADKLTIAYVSIDENDDRNVNLGVIINKEQYDELSKFTDVPDMLDGNTKTKKGRNRPEFLRDKYVVKVSVRAWSIVKKPVEFELETAENIYIPGRVIKLHAVPQAYENAYGRFVPLFAKAIRIYNELNEDINDVDKDF